MRYRNKKDDYIKAYEYNTSKAGYEIEIDLAFSDYL
jgi:hypothetical protein